MVIGCKVRHRSISALRAQRADLVGRKPGTSSKTWLPALPFLVPGSCGELGCPAGKSRAAKKACQAHNSCYAMLRCARVHIHWRRAPQVVWWWCCERHRVRAQAARECVWGGLLCNAPSATVPPLGEAVQRAKQWDRGAWADEPKHEPAHRHQRMSITVLERGCARGSGVKRQ